MTAKLTPREAPVRVGDAAPDFTLKDQNKQDWKLSDALERGPVVLSFYPMSFSSVCETEMRCVTDEFAKWQAKGAQVVGISCDSFYVQKAWAESLGLKQPLLADMHREVTKAYGFYWPELNVSRRGTVIVEKGPGGEPRVKWVQSREAPQAMKVEEVLGALG
jgi:peroxiredoxin